MRVFRDFNNLPDFNGAVVTQGSFDGLHRGHISLLNRVKEQTERSGGESVVLTFDPHPRVVLGRAEGLRLLTSTEEKILLLERFGIDNLIVIPFDKSFSCLSYCDFVKSLLVDKIKLSSLVIGYNHNLGRDSEGKYDTLLRMSLDWGFDLVRVDEWCDDSFHNVSSTVVRSLIAKGEVERANKLLYRPYTILGQADSDGRVWSSEPLKLLPAKGRYSVIADGKESKIEIDGDGIMWCDKRSAQVHFEVISKID